MILYVFMDKKEASFQDMPAWNHSTNPSTLKHQSTVAEVQLHHTPHFWVSKPCPEQLSHWRSKFGSLQLGSSACWAGLLRLWFHLGDRSSPSSRPSKMGQFQTLHHPFCHQSWRCPCHTQTEITSGKGEKLVSFT